MAYLTEDYSDTQCTPDWRCNLLGCNCGDDYYGSWACCRCGSEVYGDIDFIEQGIIPAILSWWRWHVVTRLTIRHCTVCGKRTGFGQNADICCDGCFDQWVPF